MVWHSAPQPKAAHKPRQPCMHITPAAVNKCLENLSCQLSKTSMAKGPSFNTNAVVQQVYSLRQPL